MKCKIRKVSDSHIEEPKDIEINTMEDLKKIDDENNNVGLIILFKPYLKDSDPLIQIYDDYYE